MEEVFQECIKDIKNNNKSVLLSSHILSEVEKLCDRVGIIRKGKMITSGTLDEMRHLTRMQFTVESGQQLGTLTQVTGVNNVRQEDNTYYFEVDSDKISAVIEYLSRFEIKKLESMPPTLEAIFKRYYEATDEVGE